MSTIGKLFCILFKEGTYIPTIYDEGVFISRAYLRDSRYSEKYSGFNIVELVVVEDINEKISEYASGISKQNLFRQNENGEWILYLIEGSISMTWER